MSAKKREVDLDTLAEEEAKEKGKKKKRHNGGDDSTIESSKSTSKSGGSSSKSKGEASDDDNKKSGFLDDLINRMKNVSIKDILYFTVIPGIIIFVIALILGMVMGASGGKKSDTDKPRSVDNIEGAYSILDNVESLKDDQIMSLRKQLASMKDSSTGRLSSDEMHALTQMNDNVATTLNKFFDAVLGIDRKSNDSQIAANQQQLSEFVTSRASTSTLYDFLKGPSPSKQLNMKVTKSGPVIPAWAGTSQDNMRTYLMVVPIVTEAGPLKAIYMVTMDDANKVDGMNYIGVLTDSEQPVEKTLMNQLSGDPKKAGDLSSTDGKNNSKSGSGSKSGSSSGSGSSGSGGHESAPNNPTLGGGGNSNDNNGQPDISMPDVGEDDKNPPSGGSDDDSNGNGVPSGEGVNPNMGDRSAPADAGECDHPNPSTGSCSGDPFAGWR